VFSSSDEGETGAESRNTKVHNLLCNININEQRQRLTPREAASQMQH